jgi:hypothetical protein
MARADKRRVNERTREKSPPRAHLLFLVKFRLPLRLDPRLFVLLGLLGRVPFDFRGALLVALFALRFLLGFFRSARDGFGLCEREGCGVSILLRTFGSG